MKKITRFCGTCLLLAALLSGLQSGRAAGPVQAGRSITQTSREDGREFTLQYTVYTEDSLRLEEPGLAVLVVDNSKTAGAQANLDAIREAIRGFLDKLARNAPSTQVAVVACGGRVRSAGPWAAGEGAKRLLEFLEGLEPQGSPRYTGALELAADLVEESGLPACVATLACQPGALSAGDSLSCQAAMQRVREAGGKSLIAALGQPKEEAAAQWEALASAPAEENFFGSEDGLELCLEQAYRRAAGVWTVQVKEKVDPRFSIPMQERRRLGKAGARTACRDGCWEVAWEVELPRGKSSPWKGALTLEAREDFPGGNGVEVSLEGSGVSQEGGEVAAFPPAVANVGVALQVEDVDAEIFLGESVPTQTGGEGVEARMLGMSPDWYGRGKTGAFSCQWEAETGTPVGSVKQIGKSIPQASTVYRLRVVFTPYGSGAGAVGAPVGRVEAEGVYRVRVVPGTLRVRAVGAGITRESSLPLVVEGGGRRYSLTALPEADPQGGGLALEAQLTGLPYGRYTVRPQGREPVECLLGVCAEDDTVDVRRSLCSVILGA